MQKLVLITVVVFSLFVTEAASQTRLERRVQKDILKFKGNDSAWIAFSTWGANRYYLGNKAVSMVEFENTIKGHSLETEALIKKARKSHQKGIIYEIVGLSAILTSTLVSSGSSNRNRPGDSEFSGGSIVLLSLGLVASTIGIVHQFKARNNYIDGIGEFNKSVKANKSATSIHIGMQQNGVGFALRF